MTGVRTPDTRMNPARHYVDAVLQGLDLDAVSRWLQEHVDGAVGPFDATLIGGGRSNLTFALDGADGRRFVVRRPPLGHVLATAHDMASRAPHHRRPRPDGRAGGAGARPVHRHRRQRRAVLRDGLRRRRRARQPGQGRSARRARAGQGERRSDRRARRSPRRRRRRRRARRPRPPRGLHRAPAEALDDAVGELQDPRAAGDRRGRRAPRRADPPAARRDDRPRRLPLRQLPRRSRARSHRRRPRLGAVHARRPARRRRLPRRVLDRPRWQRRAAQRPVGRRGLPDLRRAARPLRHAHRS